jgi:hypothetical protein
MKFRKPSPSMVVSVAALVMASTGSAVAAVSFAKNAGAVDHKSAVGASTSLNHAADRLVATRGSGHSKGKIPNKFLGQVPYTTTFSRVAEVSDNLAGASTPLGASALGLLSATCNDQANQAGNEDPSTTVTFTSAGSTAVNVARQVGGAAAVVTSQPAGTAQSFQINNSNTFRVHVELSGVDVVYEGQVRQDGRGTAAGSCYIAGTSETVVP